MDEKTKRGCNEINVNLSPMVTLNDLIKFKEDLIDEIRKLLQTEKTAVSKRWLKSAEVRKLLSISAGSLQNLRVSGLLPFTKIGGAFYYSSDDIVKMLENSKT